MLNTIKRAVADTLYLTRIQHGLSQEKMAEKCFMSYRQYNDLENGKRLPTLQSFIDIVIAFDINVNLIIKSIKERGYLPNDNKNSA